MEEATCSQAAIFLLWCGRFVSQQLLLLLPQGAKPTIYLLTYLPTYLPIYLPVGQPGRSPLPQLGDPVFVWVDASVVGSRSWVSGVAAITRHQLVVADAITRGSFSCSNTKNLHAPAHLRPLA